MAEFDKIHSGAKVAFGDVVQLSKVRSKNPVADGFDRYVGLEHLAPNDLKIRSWGDTADGTTFTNVFELGQVLFGKRRAYQRKVAVAEFAGVCSGDIYVLEPKGGDLLPELLPFICQTERFFDHAVATSAGSLSPRTNWKSLVTFEFTLPSLEEQLRMVEVLTALEDYTQKLSSTADSLKTVLDASLKALIPDREDALPAGWKWVKLGDVAQFVNGRAFKLSEWKEVGLPIIRIENLNNQFAEYNYFDGDLLDKHHVTDGDLLVSWSASLDAYIWNRGPAALNQHIFKIIPDFTLVDKAYLYLALKNTMASIRSQTHGGTMTHVTKGVFDSTPIPLPPLEEQKRIADKLDSIKSLAISIDQRIDDTKRLKKSFMREVLSE